MILFARTRRVTAVALITLFAVILVLACGPLRIAFSPDGEGLVLVAMMVPLLPALTIAASLVSPVHIQERAAARSLVWVQRGHVSIWLSFACVTLGLAATFLSRDASFHEQGAFSIVRNTIALTGISLLAYGVLGPRLGWVLATVWVILPPLVFPRPQQDAGQIFTLIYQPDDAFVPFVVAGLLGVAGLWSVGSSRLHLGRSS